MSKITNPFVKQPGYNCFGCSPDNKFGLKLSFVEEGEEVIAHWLPQPQFQGWNNTLHGGIQTTLLDEIASWLVFVKLNTSGVTSRMEVKLRKPVAMDQGALILKARLREMKRNIAVIDTWLYSHQMELLTEAVMYYYTFPADIAAEKFWYPGKEAFYDEPV
ncbi:MAG: PaaI family thioesterase [Lentimicrobiaceae bacterium]|nr:PaaI family thioesterase [Lentimicrobiaceae bacterium]MCB9023286.1 PaaI family thioesterase [Lentimicrobiaceae bacterium]MCO5266979.1 PaaI family thioesterase [Lentimicrobium sp.]